MPRRIILAAAVFVCLLFATVVGEEGMYPISELSKLDLKAKGLTIDPISIYNPKGTSLIEGIVNLPGCSASFVSSDGLIITNHHCVFSAVQAASTPEHDYITDGFLAQTRGDEIPARDMTAQITEQMRDVSADVLSAVREGMEPLERSKAIEARIDQLTKKAQDELPGKTVRISEMLAGKSYVMFISTTYRDVRLAYVPPRSIGEFGGEDDNWVWPRHTGDFSFVRAYAGPDGKPAGYAASNVPYHPRKFLKVNPAGVNEGDFVFILGYPGRTYRHQTSYYMAYEGKYRMPFVADLNAWQIAAMEELGREDRAIALKFDARIKGLANTMKNYRGKLAGMNRLGLVAQKEKEEAALQKYIDGDPKRRSTYGTVLEQTKKIYEDMSARAPYELLLDTIMPETRSPISQVLRNATTVVNASREMVKPSAERQAAYRDDALNNTRRSLAANLANYHEPAERLFFRKVISLAAALPQGQRVSAVDRALRGDYAEQSISRYVDDAFARTTMKTGEGLASAIGKTPDELAKLDDPVLALAEDLAPLQQQLREVRTRRNAELSRLSALLIDVKQKYLQKDFIPDANGTLRFTFGHVRGYSPADATYLSPITTLAGVMQKTKNEYPYATPQVVRDLYKARDYGRYRLPKVNELPVDVLYDTDTTGGNSGSPLMNARGELVGINFDRAWEATINDYAWNEAHSRSIAVDIRYVLWLTEKVGKATFLLREMGVK
jgi:hypothetical protein